MERPVGTEARVAVIGDVGGHLRPLLELLVGLGMDAETRRLPADLTVVQLGDLVHRGPDSPGVLELVDHFHSTQPGRWVQVLGNHEQQYVCGPAFSWPEELPAPCQDLLRQWWRDGLMHPAAAVRTGADGDWLLTHAGLTAGFWRRLGSPTSAVGAARAINALDRGPGSPLWRAGQMLGAPSSISAGPVWAVAGSEVLGGWCHPGAPELPFHQVHGHSRAVDSATGAFRGGLMAARATRYDPRSHFECTTCPGGRLIIGVDPGHEATAEPGWAPLVLHGADVIA